AAQAEQRRLAQEQTARRRTAQGIFDEGLKIYERDRRNLSNLEAARAKWREAFEHDTTFERARVYLEDTEPEFNRLLAERQRELEFERREAAAASKLDTAIPISTLEPTPLPEFLRTLKLLSGIDFVLTGGVESRIEAAFTDKPLREVLDSVLLPIGLRWERRPGEDTVVITPNLQTKVFRVSPDKLATVDSLMGDKRTIQRLLWGPTGQPLMDGQEIYTDARQNVVVLTDSPLNIEKFANLLAEMDGQAPGLDFASYKIQEDKAQQIKALLGMILSVNDDMPYNPDRKLIVEGGELIIKDTPENIRRVEELLKDRDFLRKIYSEELAVRTFNLTPILDIEDNPDLARKFAEDVKNVVETLLYAQVGRRQANQEGRRLWYDEATLQLTITDYPERLRAVEQFIESLPQIENKRRTKIVILDWTDAGDISSQISQFIGGGVSQSGQQGQAGEEVVRTMRTEQSFDFRGYNIRVRSVNENDVNDEFDDDVELIVRSGTQSEDRTIEQYRLENFMSGELTIIAEDIKPSSTPGQGRAKLRIIYNGPSGQFTQQQQAEQLQQLQALQDTGREPIVDVEIVAIENPNALWISYENVADLNEVEFWIQTLDRPTLQVSLEAKFVEVVENKARQLKADFSIGDITQGVSLTDSIVRSRFAQDLDEFDSPFEPLTESVASANLLKGATVTNWIINNGQSPVSLTLRALEAQGVINVVNAPSITVLNKQSATFEISRRYVLPGFSGTGTTNNQDQNQQNQNNQNQQDQNNQQNNQGTTGGGTGSTLGFAGITLDLIDTFDVSPSVTQSGNILLESLDISLQDFDVNLGAIAQLVTPNQTLPGRRAITNTGGFGVLQKEIQTSARIRDGGTIVLGGWKNERLEMLDSGVPVLRDIPFIGKFLFNRSQETSERVTLLIFLTGSVVND
ncbi:MAG: hypothetical protein KF858_17035, partial [Candidatus Sumerlaeia bacterium]|nr:hypothetical protein [Candidatus Sumerlaeia bacterium]